MGSKRLLWDVRALCQSNSEGVFPGRQLCTCCYFGAADENSGIAGRQVWWGLRDDGGLWGEGEGHLARKMEIPSGAGEQGEEKGRIQD